MERKLKITYKEPAWKQALMNSSVLTAKPNEKGYLPSYLDGIFPNGREEMESFTLCLILAKVVN